MSASPGEAARGQRATKPWCVQRERAAYAAMRDGAQDRMQPSPSAKPADRRWLSRAASIWRGITTTHSEDGG